MFWLIAFLVLLAAAAVTFLPLLKGKSLWQPAALALTFLLPAAGLWIYNEVGTPAALELRPAAHPATSAAADSELDPMIDGLRARLKESPNDVDGWMLLARTLKTVQRYPEALEALEIAHGVAPDNPAVMVELAETRIFVSANGRIDESSVAMLERAVELEPESQKGLWLLGIAAAQEGDLARAVSRWESLLGLLEPGSGVAQSVQQQIDEANARLGRPAAAAVADTGSATAPASDTGGWSGTPVRVAASESSASLIPSGAVLFVIVRAPGPAVGPPLGVRRVIDPILPLDLTITDGDSMLEERKISLESEVQLQARISLSGSPTTSPGDWQSAPVSVALDGVSSVELIIDQQVE